ncbi:hypothetical protein Dsin_007991 [Dipteronia sinensis]|uniref:WD repeat-containing protein 44 n=1 Tax=Dipteronia sinensis TaxID=43782 RepID=A0AAE0EHD2_9ROSI|nr:hypothetical protein Dsin_007991 [Dipteronia sinensis]
MAGSCADKEDDQFFDTREEICSVSDRVCDSDCSEDSSVSSVELLDSVSGYSGYELWTKYPESVNERRRRFLTSIDLSLDRNFIDSDDLEDLSCDDIQLNTDRITKNSGAVLRNSGSEDEIFSSNQSSMSSWSCEAQGSSGNNASEDNFSHGIKNSDCRLELVSDDRNRDEILGILQDMGSSRSVNFDEFQQTSGSSSPSVHMQLSTGDDDRRSFVDTKSKSKRSWLKKLGALAHIVDRHGEADLKPSDHEFTSGSKMQRVRVHHAKKQSKELSSLYTGQEFVAHKGSILTMKFSLDGRYLASAGEDGTVRVWKVIEDETSDRFDIQEDPSCVYFTINHLSQLTRFDADKESTDKTKSSKKSSDSTCVVLPPKVFRLLEKPLHEFRGHSHEVLDLSWSKNGFLLSSSVDMTVRLWQVGCNRCLRVFSHNNYVTSVAFNPVDDNYFISGSIDGKVRIWEVLRCQVVDYTDIREIVTAACYRPDGKGGIVGTMTGNCHFYGIIENQLHQHSQICLQSKKKIPGKRITGFQFCPTDPSKVIVTSADSLVRILCGEDIVCKFKASGFRIAGNQMFATFTSDGKHVVSSSEDSNVYVWNYANQEKTSCHHAKSIWSCESFLSNNASIAVPWFGIEPMRGALPPPAFGRDIRRNIPNIPDNGQNQNHHNLDGELEDLQRMSHSSPDCFSLARGFLLEYITRGVATWPEEKLPNASAKAMLPPICKSKLKLLKSACQNILSSPHLWGLVVVTASWDGRIRTYLNYGLPIRL